MGRIELAHAIPREPGRQWQIPCPVVSPSSYRSGLNSRRINGLSHLPADGSLPHPLARKNRTPLSVGVSIVAVVPCLEV